MPQIKRVFGQRVAVDADEKHICALVEDALRAIAVVVVHIQHNHPFGSLIQQRLGGHRCVVQKAVAAHEIRAGMVTRWPGAAKRRGRACGNAHGGTGCCVCTGFGGFPSALGQGRSVVHRVEAQLGNEVGGLHITAQCAHGPDRWEWLRGGVDRVQRHPLRPGGCQKVEVALTMYLF